MASQILSLFQTAFSWVVDFSYRFFQPYWGWYVTVITIMFVTKFFLHPILGGSSDSALMRAQDISNYREGRARERSARFDRHGTKSETLRFRSGNRPSRGG